MNRNVEWRLIESRTLRATKSHPCNGCDQNIAVGEMYVRSFFGELEGTGTLTERMHLACVKQK